MAEVAAIGTEVEKAGALTDTGKVAEAETIGKVKVAGAGIGTETGTITETETATGVVPIDETEIAGTIGIRITAGEVAATITESDLPPEQYLRVGSILPVPFIMPSVISVTSERRVINRRFPSLIANYELLNNMYVCMYVHYYTKLTPHNSGNSIVVRMVN